MARGDPRPADLYRSILRPDVDVAGATDGPTAAEADDREGNPYAALLLVKSIPDQRLNSLCRPRRWLV